MTPPTPQVRRVTPSDLPTLLALLQSCGLYTSSVTLSGATFWLAELGGVPAGCIGLEYGTGASLIRSVAVRPAFRSRGLGETLVQTALDAARARRDRAVYLFSSEAGGYWQRLGFLASTPAEVVAALPGAPQVRHGLEHGWLAGELVWTLPLSPISPTGGFS